MPKRKPKQETEGQLDMFGGWMQGPGAVCSIGSDSISEPDATVHGHVKAANDAGEVEGLTASTSQATELSNGQVAKETPRRSFPDDLLPQRNWSDDDWWTTAMVCAYLKLGRKAVWTRLRNQDLGFPKPTCFASQRPRWRSTEVKTWASRTS